MNKITYKISLTIVLVILLISRLGVCDYFLMCFIMKVLATLIALTWVIYFGIKTFNLLSTGIKINGKVVNVSEINGSDGDIGNEYTINYEVDGNMYSLKHSYIRIYDTEKRGEFEIIFDPMFPKNAVVNEFLPKYKAIITSLILLSFTLLNIFSFTTLA